MIVYELERGTQPLHVDRFQVLHAHAPAIRRSNANMAAQLGQDFQAKGQDYRKR